MNHCKSDFLEPTRIVLLTIFTFLITFSSVGQSNISLKIVDKETGDPLIGANVQSKDNVEITDLNGDCSIALSNDDNNLIISYIGYDTYVIRLNEITTNPMIIGMSPTYTTLDLITVTGSKYEQNIASSGVSIDILKPDLLQSVNSVSADDILNKIPGVQVLDGQANIRGGSGYSYGAGSRVMLLIDDIPALQPDAGFPNWNDIPVENLSQIEVLKGAASSLYGSSALNGIINYRTAYAKSEPETRVSAAFGVFDGPNDETKKWWADTLRYSTNTSIVHKGKYGKIDFVGSGFYTKTEGFNQFTNENRGRINANIRYRFTERLSIGLNTIANFSQSNSFFLWGGPASKAMQAFPGTVSDRTARRLYFDPTASYKDKFGNYHKVLTRITHIKNENNTNQSNTSLNSYGEYQFQRDLTKWNLILTSGVVFSSHNAESQILGDTLFKGASQAFYLQGDKKFLGDLVVNAGLRYEYNSQTSPANFMGTGAPATKNDGRWVARASANYALYKYSNIRISWGQGYRFPTLTERFVTTTFGSFSIFSNPFLNPEYGWSTELGLKQGIKINAFKGFIDISGFVSEYDEMIEFTFVSSGTNIGFQPQNVGDTRISGIEGSIIGTVRVRNVDFDVLAGYTYLDPKYKNWETDESIKNSVSGTENVLKYRSKHQLKFDVQGKYKKLKIGLSLQKVSHVINIDRAFESVPPINFDVFGIGEYRKINNKGYNLVDARISYLFGKLQVSWIINNVLNTEYTLRPALLEAPRQFTLRLDYKI